MAKKTEGSPVKVAWIGAGALIVATLISGILLYFKNDNNTSPSVQTNTQTVNADSSQNAEIIQGQNNGAGEQDIDVK